MNRLTAIVLVSLISIFSGVQAGAATKVGFVLSTLQEERYQKDQKYFIDEAKKLGLEPIVVAADNNAQTQTAKVENLLSQGVKVLVIQAVNSGAAANLVAMAHQDKVPVIAYDRLITNAPVDYYITVNAVQIGALQAEAAVKATGGKGNFIILKGQAGHSIVNEHMKGIHSVLSKHKGIKIVVEKNHDQWSPALAMTTTENALAQYKNDIAAVIANNSGMANGAVQALAAQKLTGKVFVAGSDADLTAIKNIVAGRQQFEVMFDIEGLARKAAQVAAQLAKGEKPKADETIDNGGFKVATIATPVLAVTKDNLEERIFKTGFHARAAVMGK
ncbi:MAG: substrate-binding domain-containing protein [Bdellovibrionota bacterium]